MIHRAGGLKARKVSEIQQFWRLQSRPTRVGRFNLLDLMEIKRSGKTAPFIIYFQTILNLPVAVFQEDDFGTVFFNAGNGNIFRTNHEVNMNQRAVHA